MTGTLKVEVAAGQLEEARKKLHSEIRKAHRSGVSLREIADAANVSHESVRRIVAST